MTEAGGEQGQRDGGDAEPGKGEARPSGFRWCEFFYAVLMFAAVGSFDPFGVSDLMRRYSQSLTNQIFGAWYPSAGQQDITVLLLTERTIERHGGYWPVRMGVHADALSQVLDAEPAAVFVDLWFKDDARDDPTVVDLARVLDLYESMDIPVYVASRGVSADERTREEIANRAHEVWAPKVIDQRDRTAVRYPLHDDRFGSEKATAAMALYERWVGVNRPEQAPSGQPIYLDAIWRSDFPDDLHVIWGTRSSGVSHGGIACTHLEESVSSALLTRLMRLKGDAGSFLSDCPYTRTILLDDLTHYGDEDLEEAFAGKIVLYGAAPDGAVDLVAPPTHASLPGVYLHAMALDNLIVWGDGYLREVDPGSWRARVFGGFELFALLATVAVALVATGKSRPGWVESKFPLLPIALVRNVLASVAVLLLNAILAWLAFAWLRLAPINWIGMLVAFGVVLDDHFFAPVRYVKRFAARQPEGLDASPAATNVPDPVSEDHPSTG